MHTFGCGCGCGEDHLGALWPGYNIFRLQNNHKFGGAFLFLPVFPLSSGSCKGWPGFEIFLIEASGDTFQW